MVFAATIQRMVTDNMYVHPLLSLHILITPTPNFTHTRLQILVPSRTLVSRVNAVSSALYYSKHTTSTNFTNRALIGNGAATLSYLYQTNIQGLTGNITFDSNGNRIGYVTIHQIQYKISQCCINLGIRVYDIKQWSISESAFTSLGPWPFAQHPTPPIIVFADGKTPDDEPLSMCSLTPLDLSNLSNPSNPSNFLLALHTRFRFSFNLIVGVVRLGFYVPVARVCLVIHIFTHRPLMILFYFILLYFILCYVIS